MMAPPVPALDDLGAVTARLRAQVDDLVEQLQRTQDTLADVEAERDHAWRQVGRLRDGVRKVLVDCDTGVPSDFTLRYLKEVLS